MWKILEKVKCAWNFVLETNFQKILEKIEFRWQRSITVIVVVFFLLLSFIWLAFGFFAGRDESSLEIIALQSEIVRNRAWLMWMLLSVMGVGVGLYLTWKGRQTQEKQWETQQNSSLHERYMKAAAMLGDPLMSVRVAGCRSLSDLAIYNKSMYSLCARLLLSYLSSPYLSQRDHDSLEKVPNRDLAQYFGPEHPLREDIQAAADSLSNIYRHAHENGEKIDNEIISLPRYFLLNRNKNTICLAGGFLAQQKMEGAFLFRANFQKTDFLGSNLQNTDLAIANLQGTTFTDANLQESDLSGAQLQGANFSQTDVTGAKFSNANITGALLDLAIGLVKEQILSTQWEIDENGEGEPPKLYDDLMDDEEVQEWCATPHYEWKDGKTVWTEKEKDSDD